MFSPKYIAFVFIFTSVSKSQNPTQFPRIDQRAPAHSVWTQRALSNVNVPNIAVQANNTVNPDWGPDYKRCVNNSHWALTFDDGPGIRTGEVLDALRRNRARATFFVVGSRVLENPAMLRRIYSENHTIALHTWSHPGLTTMTNEQIVSELLYTAMAVKQAIGVTPRFMRPPYGDIDDRARAVIRALGFDVVVWNHDTIDTSSTANVTTYFRSILGARDGPVTLQHDLFDFSVTSGLPALDVAGSSGYDLVEVGTCLQQSRIYDESIWTRLQIDPNNPGPVPSPAPILSPPGGSVPSPSARRPSTTANIKPTESPKTSDTTPTIMTAGSIMLALGLSLFTIVAATGLFV